jgi:hypothetical protein
VVVAEVPPEPAVVAVVAPVVDDDDEELPHAPNATAAATAKGIIFFKASLRVYWIPDPTAPDASAALRRSDAARNAKGAK